MSQLDLIGDGMATYTGARDTLDRYFTPVELVDALMSRINPLTGHECRRLGIEHSVLEPCAGRALSIARAVESWGRYYAVTTGDVDRGADVDVHGDATQVDWRAHRGAGYSSAITNPPFSVWRELALHLIEGGHVSQRVILLLRLSVLEPLKTDTEHVRLLTGTGLAGRWGLSRVLVTPRVSFRRGGKSKSDSVTTAWFVWESHYQGRRPEIEFITCSELERWRIARAAGEIGGTT